MHGALASGAFSVAREPLELGRSVLDPAWRMVVSQGAQRTKLESLRLTRTVAPEVPTVLLGDATRLVQVVTNLLTNAVKVSHPPCLCASSLDCKFLMCLLCLLQFTPEGGGIHLHVDVTDDAPAATADADATAAPPSSGTRWLRVRVSDTGIGVDPGASACMSSAPFLLGRRLTALGRATLQPSCSASSCHSCRRMPPLSADLAAPASA